MNSHKIFLGFLIPIVLGSWGCQGPTEGAGSVPIGTPVEIEAPLGLPPVLIPADNPPTAETISLGRRLYYDPMLSVDDTVACASCHHPDFGFTDGKPVSEGVNGQKGGRNAPTVFNVAYSTTQFWDGRSPNLENQAEGPVQNPIEMAHTLEGVEQKLTADPTYQAEFEKAFGPGPITYEKVEKAIASFERTVISGNSPFDRYFYGGDETALSEAAKRGLEILRDPQKGNCTACHPIGLFTDNQFHNIGVGVDDQGELTDLGRYEVTKKDSDRGAFKTPSLRNIALTGPYMHDGSLKTLKEVVDFYIGGGNSNPHLDPQLKVLTPTTETGEVNWSGADLEAFLEALTGEIPPNLGPLN
ncbi:MAG: cytochrome-c peroxidase [Acidobacteria bacterium]|nr:cytochrome-c peroxidase [Acidobacteriota bacterium]